MKVDEFLAKTEVVRRGGHTRESVINHDEILTQIKENGIAVINTYKRTTERKEGLVSQTTVYKYLKLHPKLWFATRVLNGQSMFGVALKKVAPDFRQSKVIAPEV